MKKKTELHGLSNHRLYRIWASMVARCFRKTDVSYYRYGGRGITVCDEWRNNFKSFYDYVTNLEFYGEKGRSIDRINNSGNYEPGNVQWATRHQQKANQRPQYRSSTGYSGISYINKAIKRKYKAEIRVNGKTTLLGSYEFLVDAVNRRNNYIISMGLHEYPIQKI